jgi:hypothetical protein
MSLGIESSVINTLTSVCWLLLLTTPMTSLESVTTTTTYYHNITIEHTEKKYKKINK